MPPRPCMPGLSSLLHCLGEHAALHVGQCLQRVCVAQCGEVAAEFRFSGRRKEGRNSEIRPREQSSKNETKRPKQSSKEEDIRLEVFSHDEGINGEVHGVHASAQSAGRKSRPCQVWSSTDPEPESLAAKSRDWRGRQLAYLVSGRAVLSRKHGVRGHGIALDSRELGAEVAVRQVPRVANLER